MDKRALKILVVDDDPPTRDFMHALLDEAGHDVVLCENGLEAVQQVLGRQVQFDVAVMDAQMPVMDGLEATRQIRDNAATHNLPIVCVSAKASGRTCEEALAAGCDSFVTKPCWGEVLLNAIWDALEARRTVSRNDAG